MFHDARMCNFVVIVFILLMPLFFEWVRCTMVYKTVKMECFPSPNYISNTVCKLKAINRYKSVSNMDCDLIKPLKNVSLNLQVFVKDYANFFKPFLVNITKNMCDILDRKTFPVYATIVVNILRRVSNFNHSCPYTGHLMTRDLYLDGSYLPVVAPKELYKVQFRFLEGYPYSEIGTVNLYIQAMEKKN